ncbi:hypothetical protein LVD13_09295 [Flavobacteriaceae bacterium D16]|nr:hypothetical protein [Flavobacteriaceae bacterium D16]
MKKVFFDKLDSRNNKFLALPMIVFMLIYLYTAFADRQSSLHQISAILGFGFSIIFLGKQFFFRNYIGWNKKGITIRLNSLLSKSISFNDISSYSFRNKKLEVEHRNGSKFNCNLENLSSDHVDQLERILKANTIANNG